MDTVRDRGRKEGVTEGVVGGVDRERLKTDGRIHGGTNERGERKRLAVLMPGGPSKGMKA